MLGTEPLAVELANTLYGEGIDFLATAEWVRAWFAEAMPGAVVPDPVQVRALRDAVYSVFAAVLDQRVPDQASIDQVNSFAAAAPVYVRLSWPHAQWTNTVSGPAAVLGRLASSCVEVVTGPYSLLRCPAPGCSMVFVRTHARRRFCHPSCSQRDRQARYYRRLHPAGGVR